ncbi:MAG TPA: hypothetical protein VF681_01440 [Abditibacteriaceae bacterium]|jgi:hypothetical protein
MAKDRVYQIKGRRPVDVISGMPVLSEIVSPERYYRQTTGTATVTSPDESSDEEALAAARQYLSDAGWLDVEVHEITLEIDGSSSA